MKKQTTALMISLTLALLALGLLIAPTVGATPPAPGAVIGVSTRVFSSAVVITGATHTTYTSSPLIFRSVDLSKISGYYLADAFVTADVNGGSTVTATPQVSNDAINWTSLPYTSGLSADGTDLQQFVLAGEYLRYSYLTTGTITITLKITLRNVGG
jgi:hypothetical protein